MPDTQPGCCRRVSRKEHASAPTFRRSDHLFGPHLKTAVFGISLATALTSIFLFLLSIAAPPIFACGGGVLYAFTFLAWVLAATTQPGIIPQNKALDDEEAALCSQLKRSIGMPDGRQVPLRWCYHCRVFRPPRAVHCPDCNVCVMRFDHHCPWISQCVGQRNYRFFFAYVWGITSLCAYTGAFLTIYAFGFFSDWNNHAFKDQIGSKPGAVLYNGILIVAVSIGVIIGVLCVGPLAIFHSRLLVNDATTSQADRKIYSRNTAAANCEAVLCDAEAIYSQLRAQCDAVMGEVVVEVSAQRAATTSAMRRSMSGDSALSGVTDREEDERAALAVHRNLSGTSGVTDREEDEGGAAGGAESAFDSAGGPEAMADLASLRRARVSYSTRGIEPILEDEPAVQTQPQTQPQTQTQTQTQMQTQMRTRTQRGSRAALAEGQAHGEHAALPEEEEEAESNGGFFDSRRSGSTLDTEPSEPGEFSPLCSPGSPLWDAYARGRVHASEAGASVFVVPASRRDESRLRDRDKHRIVSSSAVQLDLAPSTARFGNSL